jgi:iron(III) transport system substrate-binding protein
MEMAFVITRRHALGGLALGLAGARVPAFAAEPSMLEAAKAEGHVTWYTTLVVGQIVRPLVKRFEAKYPGITVDYIPAPGPETSLRISNEARAAQVKGDLVDGGSTYPVLAAAGLLQPYVVNSAAHFPAAYRDPNGMWTAYALQPSTPSINTDQVPVAEIPQAFDDLLHPRWQGRMAWPDAPNVSGPPGFIGNVLTFMGRDKGMVYLEKLAKQKIANVPSNQRVVLDQNIAGQYPLVLMIYNYHAGISMAEGAPIQWLKLNPTMVSFGQMSLIKNAPHPNAAKLFMEFTMSDEGQTIFADAGYLPASPSIATKAKGLRPDDGNYPATIISAASYAEHEKDWMGIYKSLFI